MNAVPISNELPVLSLLVRSVVESWVPLDRNRQPAPVREFDSERVVRAFDTPSERQFMMSDP